MMQISQEERHLLRELAKRYAELAQLPVQVERRQRAYDVNNLIPRRPMVWIHEIPWHEMDIDGKLQLVCQDEFARGMEWHFRSTLFRWEYIQADMVVDDFFPIVRTYANSGMGIKIAENVRATDDRNHIISHSYIDQLDTLEKVEALKEPVITAFPEEDARKLEMASEILDGILPARLTGHYFYHAPWDQIPRYRGVEPVMIGLIDQPELMHATIKKFTENALSVMKQMEALGLLEGFQSEVHCTPGYVSGAKTGPSQLKDIWFRGTAQMFGDISPAMHEEFDLQYMRPLMAECGLVYYGCCEALDNKIPQLKAIPNLRKVGVSPWANPENCAEQIGGRYVYANKPNPAHVSGKVDVETVKRDTARVIETCLAHQCPYEFVLKDISTVSYRPENLIEWNRAVQQTIDHYYT